MTLSNFKNWNYDNIKIFPNNTILEKAWAPKQVGVIKQSYVKFV